MLYDLVVIGGGWAGFNAAEYAASHGLKTALIEKDALGGTCLNYGCIPTKSLLHTAKLFSQIKKAPDKFAINIEQASIDISKLNRRKEEIISRLKSGLDFLVKANKIDLFNDEARIIAADKVQTAGGGALETRHILIATGSRPQEHPKIKFDGRKIISSKEALDITSPPANILIIGGGVIGCEFAEIFCALGTKVEVVELASSLLPGVDKDAARKLEAAFKKKGIKVSLNTDASGLGLANYEKVLLCVGRVPASDCFRAVDIKREREKVIVNEYLQTSIPNVYAAGDCVGGYLLAHKASYEGRLAAENIRLRNVKKAEYKAVPSCIFTNPEIAVAGLNEEQARDKFTDIRVRKMDFLSCGASHVIDETEGFIKVIEDAQENILGAVIAGPRATELIHVLALAINNSLKSSQIRDTIFAHPTLSEIIAEVFSR